MSENPPNPRPDLDPERREVPIETDPRRPDESPDLPADLPDQTPDKLPLEVPPDNPDER